MRTPDQAATALRKYAQDTVDNYSPDDHPAAHEVATDTLTVLDDRDALAATVQRVGEWMMVNEIDEPPLDWAGLGDILRTALDNPRVHYGDIPQTCRDALDEVYKPDGVETWWNAANRMLAGERPRDLWHTVEGRRRVLAVIEAITVGGVVM